MNLMEQLNRKKVLIAAHRGTCGGNIPCNSIAAFQAALYAGADIIELDVERSADGELFVLHPGMEPVHLRMRDSIKTLPASALMHLRLSNCDLSRTEYGLIRLEDALTFLCGKCTIAIDKFKNNPEAIAALIHKLKMEDQVLIKTDYSETNIEAVEKYASDIPYLPFVRGGLEIHENLMRRNIRYAGLEALFETEESPAATKEFLACLHADGKLVWGNAIVYNYREVLSAGHTDDVSVTGNPELGWGWLADHGFDIIQTDFAYHCRSYLEQTGRRTSL